MGYEVYKLQNTSGFSGEKPDTVILKDTPEWEAAYQRWSNGKNPTNSTLWKRGVFACTRMLTRIIYECSICSCYHPWDWDGDCRDNDNRFFPDEYAKRLGISEAELDIRSMDDRLQNDSEWFR